MQGNLVFLDLLFIPPSEPSPHLEISAFAKVPLSWDLWHARLGHPGGEAVKRLPHFASGTKVDTSHALRTCEPCIMAKHPRKPYPASSTPPAAHILDLVHSDLCGPFPIATPHGKHHFVIFLDDHSNLLSLQLLATKDQALEAWEMVRKRWENRAGRSVKVFRSDNGGEFMSSAFTHALTVAGIERQLSAPYAHQQNGKAERAIRTIEGRLFAMLQTANLPSNLWGEAALTICYLWNRTESSTLPAGITPYEILNGRKPDLSHLRVWGARCFARIPSELQVKLGPHSRHAFFMGYPEGTKAYRLRDRDTGTFFTARDVQFDENMPSVTHSSGSDSDSGEDNDTRTLPPLPSLPPASPAQSTSPTAAVDPRRSSRPRVPTKAGQAYAEGLTASRERLASLREARADRARDNALREGVSADLLEGVSRPTEEEPIENVEPNADVPDLVANVVIEEQAHIAIRSNKKRNPHAPDYDMSIPPATYDEAMKRSDSDQWLAAMKAELQTMKDMGVYRLTKLPPGRKAIGCRWVLEFKEDNKGGPVQKARLVAQGFSQVPGVDYSATFAPVIKTASVRLIAALACRNNWELDTFDARRAFLWGILKEEIYMRQPKGFEDGDWALMVWLMLRTIYGLKQSAMEWYEQVRAVMLELGFTRCAVDHAVFIYDKEGTTGRIYCIVGWHVDDGMGTSNSKPFLTHVKSRIAQRFGIKDLGPIQRFLGIQFERNRATRQLWMHQGEYITYLLDEYDLLECNPVLLPLDANHPFGRDSDIYDNVPNLPTRYRKIVGELLYLAICTRADIVFAVNALAQRNASPSPRFFAAAKRLLRYLSGTLNLRAHFGGDRVNEGLHAFCDADWASSAEDRLSISGYAWFFAGGLIAHVSKKQTTHALSSTEAEYMAVTHVMQEGLWLKSFVMELHIPITFPIVIYMDNTGAISLSKEAKNHIRSKHIDIRYHFIREWIEKGVFLPYWLPSHRNVADILTKALPRPLFTKHVASLRLLSR